MQGRLGITRRDIETALNLSANVARYRDSKEAFPTIPETHSGIDGITQEARWPIECQVLHRFQSDNYSQVTLLKMFM